MNTPVTATVAEPVRAKRPTLYGVLYPSELEEARCGRAARLRLWTDPKRAQDEKPVCGSVAITIPGEDTPAPTGWRPASEVPDTNRDVAVHPPIDEAGDECRSGFFASGEWFYRTIDGQKATDLITHWHELPTPPGATP